MTDNARQRIIDKIIALKQHTVEQGASEDEAAAFAQKAAALMEKYAIEEGDLTSLGEHTKDARPIKYLNPWRRDLIDACAQSVFCQCLFGKGEDVVIVGRPLSIEVCWEMYWFIEAQVIQIGRDMYPGDLKAQRRFSSGAGAGVATKLAESRRYDSDSMLPVVQELEASEAAMKSMFDVQVVKMSRHRPTLEYVQGLQASDRIKLRKDVE